MIFGGTWITPPPATTVTPTPAPVLQPFAAITPKKNLKRFESPEYGIQAFLWWKHDVARRDLDLIHDMGFKWVKHIFSWRDLEQIQKGHYDWYTADTIINLANRRGLKILARLDRQPFWAQEDGGAVKLDSAPPKNYSDFGDFCYVFASRYKGKIGAYQVWNEPNLAREWGNRPPNPAEYVRLLSYCYAGIKAANPDAIVISAGLAPTGTDNDEAMPDDKFVRGMYAAGGAPYFDVLGVNAPGYFNPPERSPEDAEKDPQLKARWVTFRHVEDIRQIMVTNGDADKQIAILEMGWTTDQVNPTYSWYAVTEEQQADYLVRAYQWAKQNWQPWVGLMSCIYIAEYSWSEKDEQYWYAITRPSFPNPDLRPAYHALKNMTK